MLPEPLATCLREQPRNEDKRSRISFGNRATPGSYHWEWHPHHMKTNEKLPRGEPSNNAAHFFRGRASKGSTLWGGKSFTSGF